VIPAGAKICSPFCETCGHFAIHWIAAGQDICEHPEGCDCEHYVPRFKDFGQSGRSISERASRGPWEPEPVRPLFRVHSPNSNKTGRSG